MSDEDYTNFDAKIGKVIGTAAASMLVSAVLAELLALLATNYSEKNFSGNTKLSPTDSEVTGDKTKTTGNETNTSGNADEFDGNNGEVKANDTQANALATDTEASKSNTNAITNTTEALDTRVGTELKS